MNPGGSTGSNSSSSFNNPSSLNNPTNSSVNPLSAPASSAAQSNDLPPGLYPELPKNPSNGSVEMPKTLGEQQALEQNAQATMPTDSPGSSNTSTAPPSLFSGAAGGLLNRQLQGFSSIGAALRNGSLGHSFSAPQIAPARPVLHSDMHASHSPAPAHPHRHQKASASKSVQHHQAAPQPQPSEMIDRYTVDQY
jgi:hypothetical protein